LWEGRYKSTLIHSDRYLLICSHYIELNPVRAGIVVHPGAYKWSSYQSNANGMHDELVTSHPVYLALGDAPSARQKSYRSLVEGNLDEASLKTIRDATNKGWPLGDERFKDGLEAALKRRFGPLPRGGRRPKAGRPPRREEIKVV
jgi:putative transposase